MIDLANPAAWSVALSAALASGLGYKAYRLGHDRVGPIVNGWLGRE
jgi:hypothetical protein